MDETEKADPRSSTTSLTVRVLVWFIALMALPYAFMMWKAKPSDDPYLARVTSADRWKYGLSLLAIALVLGLGNRFCDDRLHELRQFLG